MNKKNSRRPIVKTLINLPPPIVNLPPSTESKFKASDIVNISMGGLTLLVACLTLYVAWKVGSTEEKQDMEIARQDKTIQNLKAIALSDTMIISKLSVLVDTQISAIRKLADLDETTNRQLFLHIQELSREKRKDRVDAVANVLTSKIVKFPKLYIKYTPVYFKNNDGIIYWNETNDSAKVVSHDLILRVVNGEMKVDFVMRDTYGNVIATIFDNAWKMYKKDEYEYNYDDRAFELVTKDHKVVCQLEYKDSAAYFIGYVGQEGGGGAFWAMPNEGDSHAVLIRVGKGDDLSKYEAPIPLMFKYPRELYIGQRAQ